MLACCHTKEDTMKLASQKANKFEEVGHGTTRLICNYDYNN